MSPLASPPDGSPDPGAGPRRVFDRARVWRLEAPAFEAAAKLIADHERPHAPQQVIGIARGGMPLANRLGALLDVPVAALTARHNRSDATYVQATGNVAVAPVPAGSIAAGRRLLVIDDICGTGATFTAVTAALIEALNPASVRTVALCRNAGAAYTPDVWVWDARDWVAFSWNADPGEATEPLPFPTGLTTGSTPPTGGD